MKPFKNKGEKSAKVRIVLKGGLGNQLFQISIGKYLGIRHNSRVLFVRFRPRNFENGRSVLEEESYLDYFYPHSRALDMRASRGMNFLLRALITVDSLWGSVRLSLGRGISGWINAELKAKDLDKILEVGPVRWVNVSTASHRAALECRDWIADVVQSKAMESENYRHWEEIARTARPTMVHWRKGDFEALSHIYGNLQSDYYLSGIAEINKPGQPIWLFTDSRGSEALKMQNQLGADRVFTPEDRLSSLETLCLLTKNAGIVCSNSTFSWWAAFLSSNSPVYEPSRVLTNSINIFEDLS